MSTNKHILIPYDRYQRLQQAMQEQSTDALRTESHAREDIKLIDTDDDNDETRQDKPQNGKTSSEKEEKEIVVADQEEIDAGSDADESPTDNTDTSSRTPPLQSEDAQLNALPRRFRKKVNIILTLIRKNGSMDWDTNGLVSIRGKVIPGSHIGSLLRDSQYQYKKKANPPGWREFRSLLKKIRIPPRLLGNDRYKTSTKPSALPQKKFSRGSTLHRTNQREGGAPRTIAFKWHKL
jgi:hypothetical protein